MLPCSKQHTSRPPLPCAAHTCPSARPPSRCGEFQRYRQQRHHRSPPARSDSLRHRCTRSCPLEWHSCCAVSTATHVTVAPLAASHRAPPTCSMMCMIACMWVPKTTSCFSIAVTVREVGLTVTYIARSTAITHPGCRGLSSQLPGRLCLHPRRFPQRRCHAAPFRLNPTFAADARGRPSLHPQRQP